MQYGAVSFPHVTSNLSTIDVTQCKYKYNSTILYCCVDMYITRVGETSYREYILMGYASHALCVKMLHDCVALLYVASNSWTVMGVVCFNTDPGNIHYCRFMLGYSFWPTNDKM